MDKISILEKELADLEKLLRNTENLTTLLESDPSPGSDPSPARSYRVEEAGDAALSSAAARVRAAAPGSAAARARAAAPAEKGTFKRFSPLQPNGSSKTALPTFRPMDAISNAALIKKRKLLSTLPGMDAGPAENQLEKARDLSKLQAALALMQRGFEIAGATPASRDASPFATIARGIAPLGGDLLKIATAQRQEERAAEKEKREQQRALSLLAYKDLHAEKLREAAFQQKLALEVYKAKAKAPSGFKRTDKNYIVVRGEVNNPTVVKGPDGAPLIGVSDEKRPEILYVPAGKGDKPRKINLQEGEYLIPHTDFLTIKKNAEAAAKNGRTALQPYLNSTSKLITLRNGARVPPQAVIMLNTAEATKARDYLKSIGQEGLIKTTPTLAASDSSNRFSVRAALKDRWEQDHPGRTVPPVLLDLEVIYEVINQAHLTQGGRIDPGKLSHVIDKVYNKYIDDTGTLKSLHQLAVPAALPPEPILGATPDETWKKIKGYLEKTKIDEKGLSKVIVRDDNITTLASHLDKLNKAERIYNNLQRRGFLGSTTWDNLSWKEKTAFATLPSSGEFGTANFRNVKKLWDKSYENLDKRTAKMKPLTVDDKNRFDSQLSMLADAKLIRRLARQETGLLKGRFTKVIATLADYADGTPENALVQALKRLRANVKGLEVDSGRPSNFRLQQLQLQLPEATIPVKANITRTNNIINRLESRLRNYFSDENYRNNQITPGMLESAINAGVWETGEEPSYPLKKTINFQNPLLKEQGVWSQQDYNKSVGLGFVSGAAFDEIDIGKTTLISLNEIGNPELYNKGARVWVKVDKPADIPALIQDYKTAGDWEKLVKHVRKVEGGIVSPDEVEKLLLGYNRWTIPASYSVKDRRYKFHGPAVPYYVK